MTMVMSQDDSLFNQRSAVRSWEHYETSVEENMLRCLRMLSSAILLDPDTEVVLKQRTVEVDEYVRVLHRHCNDHQASENALLVLNAMRVLYTTWHGASFLISSSASLSQKQDGLMFVSVDCNGIVERLPSAQFYRVLESKLRVAAEHRMQFPSLDARRCDHFTPCALVFRASGPSVRAPLRARDDVYTLQTVAAVGKAEQSGRIDTTGSTPVVVRGIYLQDEMFGRMNAHVYKRIIATPPGTVDDLLMQTCAIECGTVDDIKSHLEATHGGCDDIHDFTHTTKLNNAFLTQQSTFLMLRVHTVFDCAMHPHPQYLVCMRSKHDESDDPRGGAPDFFKMELFADTTTSNAWILVDSSAEMSVVTKAFILHANSEHALGNKHPSLFQYMQLGCTERSQYNLEHGVVPTFAPDSVFHTRHPQMFHALDDALRLRCDYWRCAKEEDYRGMNTACQEYDDRMNIVYKKLEHRLASRPHLPGGGSPIAWIATSSSPVDGSSVDAAVYLLDIVCHSPEGHNPLPVALPALSTVVRSQDEDVTGVDAFGHDELESSSDVDGEMSIWLSSAMHSGNGVSL